MATTVSPIKVGRETDELISHAAHFLRVSKKDVVDAAVREYIDNHRADIGAAVRLALGRLDGSTKSAVSLLTGLSDAELEDLGGFPE